MKESNLLFGAMIVFAIIAIAILITIFAADIEGSTRGSLWIVFVVSGVFAVVAGGRGYDLTKSED
jgi:hypothetical protein